MDKYYLLYRKVLLESFNFLKNRSWDSNLVDRYNTIIMDDLYTESDSSCMGMRLQMPEMFLEQLYQATEGEV